LCPASTAISVFFSLLWSGTSRPTEPYPLTPCWRSWPLLPLVWVTPVSRGFSSVPRFDVGDCSRPAMITPLWLIQSATVIHGAWTTARSDHLPHSAPVPRDCPGRTAASASVSQRRLNLSECCSKVGVAEATSEGLSDADGRGIPHKTTPFIALD